MPKGAPLGLDSQETHQCRNYRSQGCPLQVVAWVIPERGLSSQPSTLSRKLKWTRDEHSPQPLSDTVDGAPLIQTPSQAERGLGGRFCFQCTILYCDLVY